MNSTKYLILKGVAGLGNRIFCIANALSYAMANKRVLVVDWSDGQFSQKGNNIFPKYFELIDITKDDLSAISSNITKQNSYPKIWGQSPTASVYDIFEQAKSSKLNKVVPLIKGKLSNIHGYWRPRNKPNKKFFSIFHSDTLENGGNLPPNLPQQIVFYADFCPPFSPDILRNHIKLSDWLNSEIEHLTEKHQLEKDTVGIHIRMTDKQPVSDLDQLIKKIKNLGFEKKQVFLATDNPEIEDSFQGIFSNLIFLPKWRPEHIGKQMGVHQYAIRNKDYGMAERQLRESIIDMWLLSKCEYLIYQQNSSFSRVSAVLKNEPTKTFSW